MNKQNLKKSLNFLLLVLPLIIVSIGCNGLDNSQAKAEARKIYEQELRQEKEDRERKERKEKERRLKRKKKKLESKLERAEERKAEAEKKLAQIKQKLQSLDTGIGELKSSIQKRKNWTKNYLQEHSGAVVCLAAFGYSIGKDNHFSDDVNGLIGAASVLCVGAALLDEEFGREVSRVVNTIKESDKLIKQWQAKIRANKLAISGGIEVLKEEKTKFDVIAEEVEEIEDEIEALEVF